MQCRHRSDLQGPARFVSLNIQDIIMAECIRKINIGTCAQRHGVIMVTLGGVLAHLYKSTESYCCHFDVGVGIGVGVTLQSFTSKLLFF